MTYEVIDTTSLDPLARPLFDELKVEYDVRYRDFRPANSSTSGNDLLTYPAELFFPPDGAFLLIRRAGEIIGGGAFQRYDGTTAELKRIWARRDQRRQGIARSVVSELESRALKQGYRRVYLTTGFRQPEALALYRSAGYEPLYDASIAPEVHFRLPFGKDLLRPGRTDTLADLRPAGPLGLPSRA